MDIKMPDMSGVNVTTRMSRDLDRTQARTPVTIFTANAFRGEHDRCLAVSRNDCLAQPYEADELLRKIVAVQ